MPRGAASNYEAPSRARRRRKIESRAQGGANCIREGVNVEQGSEERRSQALMEVFFSPDKVTNFRCSPCALSRSISRFLTLQERYTASILFSPRRRFPADNKPRSRRNCERGKLEAAPHRARLFSTRFFAVARSSITSAADSRQFASIHI